MATRTLAVLSAGLGQPSSTRLLADRLSAAAARLLEARGVPTTVEVVEVRDVARDLADHLVAGATTPALRRALETVQGADALVAVSPVFAASYSGLFKTFVDVLDRDSLRGVPVLLGATAGTQRHSLVVDHALRPLFSHLGALVVPTGVFAAPEDWAGGGDPLGSRADRAGAELADLVAARAPRRTVDPYDDAPDFAALLAGGR